MSFKDTVLELAKLDAQQKALSKRVKLLKDEVKDYMEENALDVFEEGPVKATYRVQERKNMNEAMLIQRLKETGHSKAIKQVEAPDEKVIEDLVYLGELDPKLLDECVERKEITVLRIQGGDKL